MVRLLRKMLFAGSLFLSAVFAAGEKTTVFSLDFEKLPAELKGSGKLVAGDRGQGKALKLESGSFLQYAPSAELQALENSGKFTFECWFSVKKMMNMDFLSVTTAVSQSGSFPGIPAG